MNTNVTEFFKNIMLQKNNFNEEADYLQKIFSLIEELIFIFDENQNFIFVNSPNNENLLFEYENFIGKKHGDIMPADINEKFEKSFELVKLGKSSSYEYCIKGADKLNYYRANITPFFENDKFIGCISLILDVTDIKAVNNKLKESEEKYRTIFDSSADAIFIHPFIKENLEFFLDVNETACIMLGYTKEELLNISPLKIISPKELEGQKREYLKEKLLAENKLNFNATYIKKDGEEITVELCLNIIDYKGQKAIMTVARDLSENKRVTQELKLQKQKFEDVIEQSIDGFSLIDEQGKVIIWNKSLEELTGISSTEALNCNSWELQYKMSPKNIQTEEYKKQLEISIKDYLKKGKSPWDKKIMSRQYDHPNGEIKYIEGYNYSIKTEKAYMLASISKDVTIRELAKKTLKLNEIKFRSILEEIQLITVMLDKDANIIFANKYFLELTGWTSQEILNKNWFEFFIPNEIKESVFQVFKTTIEKNEYPSKFENEITCKSGEIRIISWNNISNINKIDENITMISIGEDISIQKKYQKELEKLVKKRTKKLKSKNKKLKKYNELFIGREFRIKELKDEIVLLKEKLEIKD